MMPIVIAVVAILAIGAGAYALTQRNSAPTNTTQVNNSQDAVPTTVETTSNPVDENVMVEGTVKEFTVTGSNFKFSQEEIRVNEGDTVKINFSSTGGFHDWVVDEFSAKTEQVNPGTPTSVEFVASKKGEYEYYCSVGSHRKMGMIGKLIVE